MSQTPTKNEIVKPKSALDIAVNQLVRASVGGIPSTVPDENLDKYVADLILKEAAAKNKLYNKEGVRAYLPHTGTPPCTLPKTNKRFLFNVVKNVDDHNQALIRKTEEEAAARRRALDHSRRYDSDDDDERGHSNRRSDRKRITTRSYRKDFNLKNKRNKYNDYDHYYSEDDIYSNISSSSKSGNKDRNYYSSRNSNHDNIKLSSSKTKLIQRSPSPVSSDSSYLEKSFSKVDDKELQKEQGQTNLSSIDSPKSSSKINIIRKGRGEVSNGSKMDKYFRKDYNPMFDVEPFIGENGWFNYDEFEQSITEKSIDVDDTKKRKKKHKEKSKHKKEKHKSKKKRKKDSDSEISSSDLEEDYKKFRKNNDNDYLKPIVYESIREWDKPKLSSGSWDPDKTI